MRDLKIEAPKVWNDLGKPDMHNNIILADPSQSSSIAAAFEMILQSEKEWPSGWKKLLSVLGNAKKFTSSAGSAADAPVIGESAVAACIDYYGTMRVSKDPAKLGFVSPRGGTGYTPDPISMLKNAPNREIAKRFMDFSLSLEGQRLWALMPGTPDGPEKYCLNRPPIRKDFYSEYTESIPEWISRPYSSDPIEVDANLREKRYDVMILLVKACAIENSNLLLDAKGYVDKTENEKLKELFYSLPDNIKTIEQACSLHEEIKDDAKRQKISMEWSEFFRNKFKSVIEQGKRL